MITIIAIDRTSSRIDEHGGMILQRSLVDGHGNTESRFKRLLCHLVLDKLDLSKVCQYGMNQPFSLEKEEQAGGGLWTRTPQNKPFPRMLPT